ncbi:hypothetical protein SDRG_15248 [Saprolegnia diclina VS20]|uniref:YCII-related domain-containing protein n=2 Tax=Saprolegnia TaxID=4769 RepID=T0Q0P4_SAPDV|nr:hypothetical protein SDRG_15248 [Saprolegnia diclina VS20]EQC26915.1 hypothetical protein SDRG_15248 [Saprolegnia diclina VS20]|eukprot:XP_008619636.1 hypothetical protein SDRG_15248 [Saprolegnia diclina VS20]
MNVHRVAARALSTVPTMRPLWMLRYTYVDGMLHKRDPFRKAHLEHIGKWTANTGFQPKLLMAGAFADPVDGAAFIFEAESPAIVEDFAKKDPYVANDLVTSFDVRQYNVVEFKKAP